MYCSQFFYVVRTNVQTANYCLCMVVSFSDRIGEGGSIWGRAVGGLYCCDRECVSSSELCNVLSSSARKPRLTIHC